MPLLLIQCRYVAHSYSGVRQGRDLRDELDWPPAPGRLHQGLIACTLANLPESLLPQYGEETLRALRWLESLPPPEIIASRTAEDSGYRRALMVAMPHNSPAKNDFARYHNDLAPVFRATPEHGDLLLVGYRWRDESPGFQQDAETHLPALRDAAARLRYLGRAEDRVECEIQWLTGDASESDCGCLDVWRPSRLGGDAVLLAARPRSTDQLLAEFKKAGNRRAREAKTPARLSLRPQSYARDAAEGRLPVHIALFHIYEDGETEPLVCDATNAHKYRSGLRNLACRVAEAKEPWVDHDLASELISGHPRVGGHTQQPHLAFVPLPSISMSSKADGRVRRFALLGYAGGDKTDSARSIYRTLAANLDGKVDRETSPSWYLELLEDPARDKVWRLYSSTSRTWATVTPVAISRGFSVPKFTPQGIALSQNERYLRKLNEWQKLLRESLRHLELPAELVDAATIEMSATPFLPKCERAERYRAPGEEAVLIHVRLSFPEPVRGPLLLGDRRYFGLGLFVPAGVPH